MGIRMSRAAYTCCRWGCNSWSNELLQPGETWWAKTGEIRWSRAGIENP